MRRYVAPAGHRSTNDDARRPCDNPPHAFRMEDCGGSMSREVIGARLDANPSANKEILMKSVRSLILAGMLGIAPATAAIAAGDPLFVNVTAAPHAHRTEMALAFAQNVAKKDHPVTIFLNDEAVMVATKAKADSLSGKMLADAMKGGITVIVCQNCMKHYKVAETDLVGGVKLGTPDLTQGALFAPNTRTLSW